MSGCTGRRRRARSGRSSCGCDGRDDLLADQGIGDMDSVSDLGDVPPLSPYSDVEEDDSIDDAADMEEDDEYASAKNNTYRDDELGPSSDDSEGGMDTHETEPMHMVTDCVAAPPIFSPPRVTRSAGVLVARMGCASLVDASVPRPLVASSGCGWQCSACGSKRCPPHGPRRLYCCEGAACSAAICHTCAAAVPGLLSLCASRSPFMCLVHLSNPHAVRPSDLHQPATLEDVLPTSMANPEDLMGTSVSRELPDISIARRSGRRRAQGPSPRPRCRRKRRGKAAGALPPLHPPQHCNHSSPGPGGSGLPPLHSRRPGRAASGFTAPLLPGRAFNFTVASSDHEPLLEYILTTKERGVQNLTTDRKFVRLVRQCILTQAARARLYITMID